MKETKKLVKLRRITVCNTDLMMTRNYILLSTKSYSAEIQVQPATCHQITHTLNHAQQE